MARYTELFSEWLENGGVFPAIFNNVTVPPTNEKLTNLFTCRYADREIGFETPTLFALKFEGLANELMTEFDRALKAYNYALHAIETPTKQRTRSGSIERTYGQKKQNTWEQPTAIGGNIDIELEDKTSQGITISAEVKDTETYNGYLEGETGLTVDEALRVKEDLINADFKNYIQVFLDKFDKLFMQIF